MPCPECGASVARGQADAHTCEAERLLDFRLFQLRDEIAAFDAQLAHWLATARGRFAAWIAERDRRPTRIGLTHRPRSLNSLGGGEHQESAATPLRRAATRSPQR
jgi:hypothetical protein